MNHQQASSYQQFFQHHDVAAGSNFHHGTLATPVGHSPGQQANVANAFMFGHPSIEDFYHRHPNQQVPLVYQAVEAAAAASNHLLRPHPTQQPYVLPSTPMATSYFNPGMPFASGNYPMPIGAVDHLSAIKYQQQQNQSHWGGQSPTAASFFPSILAGQQHQSVADTYFNVATSQSNVVNQGGPLAGLRALSEQYNCQGGRKAPKSPPKASIASLGNADYLLQQQRHGRDSAQPATPNVASPSAGVCGPGTNSPQQTNLFIPPSPVLKSSQTAHSSPLSSTTTHSSHCGNSFLVGSPATPRGRSVSSAGSVDTHLDPKTVTASGPYAMVDGRPVAMENIFSMPVAPQHATPYEESLSHSSNLASFYTHGIDPAAALMDPTSTTLFGTQMISGDPSLHSAVDDALSVLGRDVNLNDLPDISCANMMVGHNFWDDLGDAVLEDPLLGSHATAGCSTSSVDLVSNNGPSAIGPGQGGLLHSVLEFGTLSGDGSGELEDGNGQRSADEVLPYRFQDDHGTRRSDGKIRSRDLSGTSKAATCLVQSATSTMVSSDATAATPKLREKLKRRAQGENELAEIDRALARHLSMVAEKDGAHSSAPTLSTRLEKHEDVVLDALTANSCLTSRLEWNCLQANSLDLWRSCSPVRFEEISTAPAYEAELEEQKKSIRKAFSRRQRMDKTTKSDDSASKTTTKPDIDDVTSGTKSFAKSRKVPIYKQKSMSIESVSNRNRTTSSGPGLSTDSPFNFTDDEDDDSSKTKGVEALALSDQEESVPMDESRQRLVDEEVTKKLRQISSLHPELKIATGADETKTVSESMLRHILPKKRQHWHAAGEDPNGAKGSDSWPAENKKRSTRLTSTFVKTEILTDDYSTAMPAAINANAVGPVSSSGADSKQASSDVGRADSVEARNLLPKLIIRIPKKCLEQTPSVAGSTPNGLNTEFEKGAPDFHHHHHHRKRKKEKRKRHDSDEKEDGLMSEEAGKKKRHRRDKDDVECGGGSHGSLEESKGNCASVPDQSQKSDGNLMANSVEMSEEKKEVGSNGLEWDRLPFKLRKKLQRVPSSSEEELAGSRSNGKIHECNSAASGNNNNGTPQGLLDEQRSLENESKALTLLRSRFPSGLVFQKGAFVVCKDDIGKPDCPIWKVDSQNLLQKFTQADRQGRTVYVGSSTFAGWCLQNQDLYVPIQVQYIVQSRAECVVELESTLEDLFPAVSTEIIDHQRNTTVAATRALSLPSVAAGDSSTLLDHPQTEALVAYVNILLFHALVGNFLHDISDGSSKASPMQEIDLVNTDKCTRLLSGVRWKPGFKEAIECYPHCTANEDEVFGLHCQACDSGVVSNVLQLFANESYDFDTLEPRPPPTTASGSPLPSQDYHLCSSCARVAVRYHKLFHMRYQLFRKCEDAVELLRDGNPTLADGTVAEMCIKNKNWLANTLNEYLQMWSSL